MNVKLDLDKAYHYRGVTYGPGEANVPERAARLIQRHMGEDAPEETADAGAITDTKKAAKKGRK